MTSRLIPSVMDARRPVAVAVLAVQSLGKDAGGGRLARAARPGEEIGVSDLVVGHLARQGRGHMGLADDLVECLGPVFAI
jgi:hypothetical protein